MRMAMVAACTKELLVASTTTAILAPMSCAVHVVVVVTSAQPTRRVDWARHAATERARQRRAAHTMTANLALLVMEALARHVKMPQAPSSVARTIVEITYG